MKSIAASFILFFIAGACSAQTLTLYGTMHHTTLEGGCWYLQTDNGKRYELIGDTGIINPLHMDSQRVGVQAEIAKGAASICMVGEIVRVTRRLSSLRHAYDPLIMPTIIDGTMHLAKSGYWYVKTTEGSLYEFQKPPAKKYQHSGAVFHQKVQVMPGNNYTHSKKMQGVILPDSQPQQQEKNIPKKYDPR